MPTTKNRMPFNDRKIKSLKPPEAGQVEWWDETFPGFGIRVSCGGRKSFVYRYRNQQGKKKRVTIGPYPAWSEGKAREEARRIASSVVDGNDPAADKKAARGAGTFKELSALYMEKHSKPNKRSWKKDEMAINRDLVPVFGTMKANGISQEDVEALLEDILDRGAPIQSNRTLEIFRGMYNWALSLAKVRREYQLNTNPSLGVKKLSAEHQRERVLSMDEIKAIWEASLADSSYTARSFLLHFMTAQRGGEIHTMRWTDIDLAEGWWTIPGERSKNKLPHRVPLTNDAVLLLEDMQKSPKDPEWIFPKFGGGGHVVNTQSLSVRIRKRSKVEDFRPHDIRRSVASQLASMGIARLTIAKVLNHVESDVTRIYDRYGYDKEKRQALESWGAQLSLVLSGGDVSENVVSIRGDRSA